MSKTRTNAGGPGGGIGSKANAPRPTTYFTGKPGTRVSPAGVAQIGSSMGNKAMDNGGKVLRGAVEPVKVGAMPKGGPGGSDGKPNCAHGWPRRWGGAHGQPMRFATRRLPLNADRTNSRYPRRPLKEINQWHTMTN